MRYPAVTAPIPPRRVSISMTPGAISLVMGAAGIRAACQKARDGPGVVGPGPSKATAGGATAGGCGLAALLLTAKRTPAARRCGTGTRRSRSSTGAWARRVGDGEGHLSVAGSGVDPLAVDVDGEGLGGAVGVAGPDDQAVELDRLGAVVDDLGAELVAAGRLLEVRPGAGLAGPAVNRGGGRRGGWRLGVGGRGTGRGRETGAAGAITLRTVVVVTGAGGAAVVVVVSTGAGGAVVAVVSVTTGAGFSMTAGSVVPVTLPPAESSALGSGSLITAVTTPTANTMGIARLRSLRMCSPILR